MLEGGGILRKRLQPRTRKHRKKETKRKKVPSSAICTNAFEEHAKSQKK